MGMSTTPSLTSGAEMMEMLTSPVLMMPKRIVINRSILVDIKRPKRGADQSQEHQFQLETRFKILEASMVPKVGHKLVNQVTGLAPRVVLNAAEWTLYLRESI